MKPCRAGKFSTSTVCAIASIMAANMLPSLTGAQRGVRDTTVETSSSPLVDISTVSGKVIIRNAPGNVVNVQGLGKNHVVRVLEAGVLVANDNADKGQTSRTQNRSPSTGTSDALRLDVPRGSRIVLNTKAADLMSEGFIGDIDFTSISGDIRLINSEGAVTARTVSGDVSISGRPSSVHISTASGDISVRGITSQAEIHSVSGDISIGGRALKKLIVDAVSGDISFTGNFSDDASVRLSTHSGDVNLDLQGLIHARLEWASVTGDLTSSIPLVLESGTTDTDRKKGGRKQFQIGGGGSLRISISTFSGDTRIRKKE